MKHLSILHLINNFGDASITRIVRDLIRHLGNHDFTWHVGGLNGTGDMGPEFRRVGVDPVVFGATDGSSTSTVKGIRDYVVANRIDIVHTHTPRTILLARQALGGHHRTIQLATKHILNSPGDRRWGALYSLLDRLLLYAPDHLVAVSNKVLQGITMCPGIKGDRVSMIRNAVDSAPFQVPEQRDSCREEFALTPEMMLIGTSGRLEKVKRYDLLLRGFSAVHVRSPQSRLMIAGDGSLKQELEQLAENLGIAEAVIWTGFRKDVPCLLAAMDIYIMSSVNEGLSLSILEAMAAGKPVIITDVGGARELVEDGITGVLIPPGSSEAITASLLALLEDPARMSALAQAGRDYVVHEFGMQRMMETYGRLYGTLAERRP